MSFMHGQKIFHNELIDAIKNFIKKFLEGGAGGSLKQIKFGLLKGISFNIDSKMQTMYLFGLYEREIKKYIERFTRQARYAIDVGAASGYYTLYFASQDNIKQVFAFEPNINLLKRAKENAELNDPHVLKKIVFIRKFVGLKNEGNKYNLDVNLYYFKVSPVIIKIDVEGEEMGVLKGLNIVLKENKCMLVVETHSQELERECYSYLKTRGYQIKIVPNAWYRIFIPEARLTKHNRWMVAHNIYGQ